MRVYVDLNNDNVLQATEPNAPIAANGSFTIDMKNAPMSQLKMSLPPGYVSSASGTIAVTFTITPGPASIGGRVMLDTESTGIDNYDPTLANRLVWLDLNSDGVRGASEPTTLSDSRGAYTFLNAPAGSYVVRVDADASFGPNAALTAAFAVVTNFTGAAAIKTLDLAVKPVAPTDGTVTLWGQVTKTLSYYETSQPILGLTQQRVFVDLNGNAAFDANEPSVISGANGLYCITNIPAGTFSVRVDVSGGLATNAAQSLFFVANTAREFYPSINRTASWSLLASGVSKDEATPTAWYRFDDEVSNSLSAWMLTVITESGTTFTATNVRWDAITRTATFTLPAMPPGSTPWYVYLSPNYLMGLSGSTNPSNLIKPMTLRNTVGDTNNDGAVNFDDLIVLAQHYNQTGRLYSEGDLNRDGTVNFDDLIILAQRYNTSPAAPPLALASAPATKRKAARGPVLVI